MDVVGTTGTGEGSASSARTVTYALGTSVSDLFGKSARTRSVAVSALISLSKNSQEPVKG